MCCKAHGVYNVVKPMGFTDVDIVSRKSCILRVRIYMMYAQRYNVVMG